METRGKLRWVSSLMSGLLVLGMAGCAREEGEVPTAEKIVLRTADVHPHGYPTVEAMKKIAGEIAEKTEGRITVDIYPGSVLGAEKATIEQTRMGALALNRVSCSPLAEFYPPIGVYSLPYLFRDEDLLALPSPWFGLFEQNSFLKGRFNLLRG